MFVGVDHRQRDGHGVADEGDGHRVSGDVGEGAQGGEPWPGEPGGRVKGQSELGREFCGDSAKSCYPAGMWPTISML